MVRKLGALVWFLTVGWTLAHSQPGVHEPLLEQKPAGPYLLDLYGLPQVGNAVFEVELYDDEGRSVEEAHVRVEVGGVPVRGNSVESAAERRGEAWIASVPVSAAGQGWMRVKLEGPQGYAEATTRLRIQPARADSGAARLVLLALLPLAALGLTLLALRITHTPIFDADKST